MSALASFPLACATDVFTPREYADFTRAQLVSFRQIENRLPGERHVYRFVDAFAGWGVFATFAGVRWPYAYLDCYEPRAEQAKVLRLNAQAGTRFYVEVPKPVPECDGLHVGLNAIGLEFDAEKLAKLRVVLWEFSGEEQLENSAGFLRAVGMELRQLAMVDAGMPVTGWSLWTRKEVKT